MVGSVRGFVAFGMFAIVSPERDGATTLDSQIDSLLGWMSRVFKPKGVDKTLSDPIVLTCDSEYKNPHVYPKSPIEYEDYEKKYGTPYPKENEVLVTRGNKPFVTFQLAGLNNRGAIVAEGIKPDRAFTPDEFVDWVHTCLDKWGVDWRGVAGAPRKIVIGSHVSRSELQHISPLPSIRKYGDKNWEAWLGSNIRVFDTYKLVGEALANFTKGAPMEKVSLEGFHGKPERHWRPNPDLLFAESTEKFWEYALVDAKALLWSLLNLRRFVWDTWHLDLLRCHSLAGLACRILESRIAEPLEPAKREKFLSNGKPRSRVVFNSDLTDVRRTALKAYQGGRREAYVMGLVNGPLFYYDFKKQYTVSTLSIPLPTGSTEFRRLTSVNDINTLIGWAHVKFKFPKGVTSCLGIIDPRFPKLVFVREGETWAGVFTLRRAINKGAKIQIISGWGFIPSEKEVNHPIHSLFRELLSLGKDHAGHFEEKFTKNIANMLVGRFVGKFDVSPDTFDEDAIEDKLAEGWAPKPKQVMGSFAPMHASLILDQARALEDHLLDLCKEPVYGHTDSIYSRAPLSSSEEGKEFIEWIQSFHGDVVLKMTALFGWVQRAAVGYFPNADPKGEAEAPHHAIHNRREDYTKSVEIMLAHPDFTPPYAVEEDSTSLREAKRKGQPLASYQDRKSHPKFDWDYKRKLLVPDGEQFEGTPLLWTEHRETEPWQSIDELLKNAPSTLSKKKQSLGEHYKRLTGKRGRPSNLTVEDQNRIAQLAMKGMTPEDIARAIPSASRWAVRRELVRKSLLLRTRHNGISHKSGTEASRASRG